MAKKPPIRVALDLETTGLHAEQDTILEIAAVKFQGTAVLDTFESLVAPGRSIPYRVQRLTGITPPQLVGAPTFESIADQLQFFLADLPIVGHSIPFDVSFLRRRGLVRTNQLIDTFELATVLLPSLTSYNLGQVAQALGVPVTPGRHRAMVDTILAMQVFLALHQRLQAVDLSLLKDLASLDAPRSWPLLTFFRQELRSREEQDGLRGTPIRGSLGDRFAAQLGMDPRILSFAIAREHEPAGALAPISAAQADSSSLDTLEQVQTLVEAAPEQEEKPRPTGYHAAHQAVRAALEQQTPLLLEVTVGGNDYTPVLLPALEWLSEASTAAGVSSPPGRLVIACSHQQGARRLVENTLPRLQATLKTSLPVAYLAEHGGYLCVHRWFGSALRRTSGELTAEQARGLAKLGLWAQQTSTGERGELTILPQEIPAWERICSGVERVSLADGRSETPYQRCVYRQKGYCFVGRAEERVKAATIVVTTYAGLFDDLTQPRSLLDTIGHRLLLDADLLEEEYARWSSVELDKAYLLGMLNTIGTELPGGQYQGLLALAAPALHENGPGGLSATPTVSKIELDARILAWFQALGQACKAVDNFFSILNHLLEESQQQASNSSGRDKGRSDSTSRGRNNERADQPLRLTGHVRNLGIWMDVERAWQHTAQRLQTVIDLLHEAERIMLTAQRSRHRLDAGGGEDSSLAWELAATRWRLLEQKRLGQQAMALEESEMVYWLRMPPPSPPPSQQMAQQRTIEVTAFAHPAENVPVLHAQHVHTSAFLKRFVLNPSAIFAGTALSVEGSFSFWRGRFGLEHDSCPAFSVVSEYHEQTLIYLPDDVPEPNAPQYQRHLDEALVQLATALDGQLVALFTSHASLRSSYSAIKPLLETQGILVLAHGIDGSPRQLWHTFQDQERIVLLGTGSFWDGVDEIPRAPACVLIARLPMPVLNDPPVAARMEHYSDQLHQVTVPLAALRLRRALNRIAWSSSRRNAIVMFDRRVISKDYGSTILHTLPHCSRRQGGVSHMPETALDWLTTTGSWDKQV